MDRSFLEKTENFNKPENYDLKMGDLDLYALLLREWGFQNSGAMELLTSYVCDMSNNGIWPPFHPPERVFHSDASFSVCPTNSPTTSPTTSPTIACSAGETRLASKIL